MQVLGTQLLQASLSWALLFISTYDPSFRSLIIPSIGLPLAFFPFILPSITSFSSPSPLITCPIQFFFLFTTASRKHLFSSTSISTCSFVFLSDQLTLSIFL